MNLGKKLRSLEKKCPFFNHPVEKGIFELPPIEKSCSGHMAAILKLSQRKITGFGKTLPGQILLAERLNYSLKQ